MNPEPGAPSPWGEPAPAYSGPGAAPGRNGDGPDHASFSAPNRAPDVVYWSRPGLWVGGTARVAPRPRPTGRRRLLRVIRSSTALVVIALSLGVAIAAGLAGVVWLIAAAIHHAAGN